MTKHIHEIRDPIHVFIRLDSDERKVLDSRPFQRLRYIHQLALTYLVYPGATHRRFEHALGVMELAGRVFDIITAEHNLHNEVRPIIPDANALAYWRRVLRMAALCHDIGHLPFSHGAEELLPHKMHHEHLTINLIESAEMREIWNAMTPPIRVDDLIKLAVGPKVYTKGAFSTWEAILSEIVVGDALGVDRMDYLLRDSLHAGVAYGRFDHYRLIDSIRILPKPEDDVITPTLGIDEGGLHSAEALLLARYFMFTQLYYHPIRRIYDIHLKDFLKAWLPSGQFSIDVEDYLGMTDNEVLSEINKAAFDVSHPGHDPARRIVRREHFRLLYERNPDDVKKNVDAGQAVYDAAVNEFGLSEVRHDKNVKGNASPDFPVQARDGRVVSALSSSDTLGILRPMTIDYVFISPPHVERARQWLEQNLSTILVAKEEEE